MASEPSYYTPHTPMGSLLPPLRKREIVDQDQVQIHGLTKDEAEGDGSLPEVYDFLKEYAQATHLSEAYVKRSMEANDLRQVPLLGSMLLPAIEADLERIAKARDESFETATELLRKVEHPLEVIFGVTNGLAESFAQMAYDNPDKVTMQNLLSTLVSLWQAAAAVFIPIFNETIKERKVCPLCGEDPNAEGHHDVMLRVPYPGELDEDEDETDEAPENTDPEAGAEETS